MNQLQTELFSLLTGSNSDLSTSQLVTRSNTTNQASRVTCAMMGLADDGLVKFTCDGKWHHRQPVHFNGRSYMIGEDE